MTTEQKAATGRTDDDLVNRIDAATADAQSEDVKPGSLEARLRLILPGHTFFKKGRGIPAPIQRLLDTIGGELVGATDAPEVVGAIWSTPGGVWMVKTQQSKHSGNEMYHLEVDGPDTDLERDDLTQDQVVDLLGAVGAIPRTI